MRDLHRVVAGCAPLNPRCSTCASSSACGRSVVRLRLGNEETDVFRLAVGAFAIERWGRVGGESSDTKAHIGFIYIDLEQLGFLFLSVWLLLFIIELFVPTLHTDQ